MRRSSAGVAMVIDDEPAIRRLLATMLSDHGCAIATGADAADLERGIADFAPDIVFLDVGLRDTDAFDLLDLLGRLRFTGAVQIVSGRPPELLDRVFAAGAALGLRMRTPLAKPFRSDAIGGILREEALQPTAEPAAPDHRLVSRAWRCATADVGLVDLAIVPASRTNAADTRLSPSDQLVWWTTREGRYRARLLDLPAPASLCVEADIADIPAMMPGLRRIGAEATHTATTLVLGEDAVFADLPAARDLLSALRACGATIRLTGCGTRFFAAAGHDPLPVDQAVLGASLSAADRVLHRLAELAHRAGTLLLADDAAAIQAENAGPGQLDLWGDPARSWRPVPIGRSSPSYLPKRRHRAVDWRPVALAEALSSRRT